MLTRTPSQRRRLNRVLPSMLDLLESRRLMSASTIDTSFSGDGKELLFAGDDVIFRAVTVLPGGKSLAVGTIDMDPSANDQEDFLVARFNANGTLDTSFGGGVGWIHHNFYDFSSGVAEDDAVAIVQLPNGKFAVAGTTHSSANSNISNFAVAQYNANGTLDSSFSGDGKFVLDFGPSTNDEVAALAVTSDYKLLVVGTTQHNPPGVAGNNVAICKVKSDGTLDTSFGGGTGKINKDFGTIFGNQPNAPDDDQFSDQFANAVHVLPSGSFLVAGSIADSPDFDGDPHKQDSYVARFTQTGSLDTTFASGKGFVKTATSSGDEAFNALAVLPDGKIIAAGTTDNGSDDPFGNDFVLVRYNANGTKDNAFGSGGTGIVRTSFNDFGPAFDSVGTLLLQPNGKILAVGNSFPADIEQPSRTALARYNANGTLDSGFSGDGRQLSAIIPNSGAIGAARTPDGKTVIVGGSGPAGVIARFGNDAAATAKISGTFYNDLNGNGVRNNGENGLADWQAFADANNDGFWTPGEKIATSDGLGKYTITGLAPGTYRIREIRLTNWNRTQPAGVYPLGFYDVTVGVGGSVLGKDFGNKHV